MTTMQSLPATMQSLPVRTGIHGRVPKGAREYAVNKVHAALRHVAWPVLSIRVTLSVPADPAVARSAAAQAVVDVNGRVVRAEAVGQTIWEAIGHMAHRLQTRLDRIDHRRTARRRTVPRRAGPPIVRHPRRT